MASPPSQRTSILLMCLLLNSIVDARRTKSPTTGGLRQNAVALRAQRNGDEDGNEPKKVRPGAQELRRKRANEKNKDLAALPVEGLTTDTSSEGNKRRDSQARFGSDTWATNIPTNTLTTYIPTSATPAPSMIKSNEGKPTIEPTTSWMSSTWWSVWTTSKSGKGGKSSKSKASKGSFKSSKSKAAKAIDHWHDDWWGDDWYGDDWYPAMPEGDPQNIWIPGVNGPGMPPPFGDDGDESWYGSGKPGMGSQGESWAGSKPDLGSKPGWGGDQKPAWHSGWGGSSWNPGWWGGWGGGFGPPTPTIKPSQSQPLFPPTPVPSAVGTTGTTYSPTNPSSTYSPTSSTYSPTDSTYAPTPVITTYEPTLGEMPTFSPSATPTEGVITTMPTSFPTGMGTTLSPTVASTNATYAPTVAEFVFPKLNTILFPDESIDEGAFFGASVGVDRRTVVVGVQEDDNGVGSAIVYKYDSVERTFVEESKLTPSNGEPTDDFGRAVAISDDYIIVGAQKNDQVGIDSGAAYIYKRTESSRAAGEWTEVAVLVPPNPVENERFGISVAIHKNVAIIGANGDDENGENAGAAYIFTLVDGEWLFTQKLVAPDGEEGDNFGFSVAIYGNQAVVGAVWDSEKSGSVYVYLLTRGGWTVEGKFVADGGNPDDQFGWSVAMWEQTIAIGAFADDTSGLDSGAVYIFEKDSNSVWNEQARVTPADGEDNDHFGRSVDIHGDWLIVSSPFDDEAGIEAGSVYIYERDDEDWLLQSKLFPQADPKDFNEFGFGVGVSDELFVASAKLENETDSIAVGSVYIYDTSVPGEPTSSPTTTPYPTTAAPTFAETTSHAPSVSFSPTFTPLPTNSSMPSAVPTLAPTNLTSTEVPSAVPSGALTDIPTFSPTAATVPTGNPTTFTPPPEPGSILPTTYFPTTLEPVANGTSPPISVSNSSVPTPSPTYGVVNGTLPPQNGSLPTLSPGLNNSTAIPSYFPTGGSGGALPTLPPGSASLPTLPPASNLGNLPTLPPGSASLPTLPPASNLGNLPTLPPGSASLPTLPPASNLDNLPTLPPGSSLPPAAGLPTLPPASESSLGTMPTQYPTFPAIKKRRGKLGDKSEPKTLFNILANNAV